MKSKSVIQVDPKSREFLEMQKSIQDIEKAKNNVMLRFPLTALHQKCVDQDSKNKLYCSYFIEAKGLKAFNDHLKTLDSENLINQMLTVVYSCLDSIEDDTTALEVSTKDIPLRAIHIIQSNKYQEPRALSLKILNKISNHHCTHQDLIRQGIFKFIEDQIDFYLQKELNSLKTPNLIEIARIFDIVRNFGENKKISGSILETHVLSKVIQFYQKGEEITFLKSLLIKSILPMTKVETLREVIKKDHLDMKVLSNSALSERNYKMISLTQQFVQNLVTQEECEQLAQEASSTSCSEQTLIYLGFVSSHREYRKYFESEKLVDALIKRLGDGSSSENLKISCINILKNILDGNQKFIDTFVNSEGLEKALQIIGLPSQENYFLISSLEFFQVVLEKNNNLFIEKVRSAGLAQNLIKKYSGLMADFKKFFEQALTTRKALNSIEYHKSEATKAILMTRYDINEKEIVGVNISLNYLACESLSISLIKLFASLSHAGCFDGNLLDQNFFETTMQLMRTFKNSKQVYTNLFIFLSQMNYTVQQVEIIQRINYQNFLCEKVWNKHSWRAFFLYCLRYVERLMVTNKHVDILRQTQSAILLIASIKNFINEEDYADFEEARDGEEEEDEIKDLLTYSDEREIHKKATELIHKLIDTVSLDNFRMEIKRLIENFRPILQTINILRANYAVLTIVNGITTFGYQGLKSNDQKWLVENIEKIEISCKRQDFKNKEKLIGDCIKAISNYVGITHSPNGRDLYAEKQISPIVFGQLEKYLDESKSPLKSYVMLKVFKEWLVERIDIIENASNTERWKIYKKEDFMMVEQGREEIIQSVMDCLYATHGKFQENQKVVTINFDVIILLGYVYPDWLNKIGNNFIPNALDVIANETFDKETQKKGLELLTNITKCDEKSEIPDAEKIDLCIEKGVIDKVTDCIARNEFDPELVTLSKKLFDNIATHEEHLDENYNIIDKLIQDIRNFNKSKDKENPVEVMKVKKAVDKLNAFCLIEPLRIYAFQKDHSCVVNDLLSYINDKKDSQGINSFQETYLTNLEKGCLNTMIQHQNSAKDPKNFEKLYGPNVCDFSNKDSLANNAFRTLRNNKNNPELVLLGSKIINKCFPSPYSKNVKATSKTIQFQPELDQFLKDFGESPKEDLSKEVKELYINLSETQNDDTVERMLRKLIQELGHYIAKDDKEKCIQCYNQLLPFVDHPVFSELFTDMNVLDYILKTLKLLHKNTGLKTKQKPEQILTWVLGSDQVPDLGNENRKVLEPERNLAKHITTFCLKLPEPIKQLVRNHDQIVELSNIAGLLNGSTETFELYNDFLILPKNKKILEKNKTFELGVYLLMKNNGDSFSVQEGPDPSMRVSSLQPRKSKANDLRVSQLSMQMAQDGKGESIQQNLKEFSKIAQNILTPQQIDDLFRKYIRCNNSFLSNKPQTHEELLNISRQIAVILKDPEIKVNLDPYADGLKSSFQKFLGELNKQPQSPPKVMKFFEGNFNEIAKRLKDTPKSMNSPQIWNELIQRYLVKQPDLIKSNADIIFQNFELSKPKETPRLRKKNKFNEKVAEFSLEVEEDPQKDILDQTNQKSLPIILQNLHKSFYLTKDQGVMLKTLRTLSLSPEFCRMFTQQEVFDIFLEKLNDQIYGADEQTVADGLDIFNNVVQSLDTEEDVKNFQKHDLNNLMDTLMKSIQNDPKNKKVALTLSNAFEFIKNKSQFKQNGLPKTLLVQLAEEFDDEDKAVLLCKMASDPILFEQVKQLDIFDTLQRDLEKKLYSPKVLVQNPPFEEFKQLTELKQDSQVRGQEIKCFLLAELSKDKESSKKLRRCGKDSPTFVLNLFDQYEKYSHIPTIATKTLHTMRNVVLDMETEEFMNNQPKVEELIRRIPPYIEQFKQFGKTPVFLQEILDALKQFVNKKLPKSQLEKIMSAAQKQNLDPKEKLNNLQDIAEIYEQTKQKLEKNPLTNEENKLLEMANRQLQNLLEMDDQNVMDALEDLNVPKNLRLIANSPNSNMIQKQEALELLNKMCGDEKQLANMLQDNFYTSKSQDLIKEILKNHPQTSQLSTQESLVLQEDLEFMKNLTNERKGVELVLKEKPQELIKDCFKVLLGDNDNIQLKVEALAVLKNLIKFGDNPSLEKDLLEKLNPLLRNNPQYPQLICGLMELTNVLQDKKKEYQDKMVEDDILRPLKEALHLHNNNDPMNSEIGKFLNKLAADNPQNQDYIMSSNILPLLIDPFQNRKSPKAFHKDMAECLIKLGFGNQEKKLALVNQGWMKGLVALLIHYSSPENYDEDMITTVLKLMANFSLVPEGVDHLLFDGVIPAFQDFFSTYKESLPEQNDLMLQTLVNLAYQKEERFVKKLIEDKGMELILDAMEHYNKAKNLQNTETAIDALTLTCHSPLALDYLEKKENKAADTLVDILRQKLGSNIVYKTLRCLTNFVQSKKLEEKILKKDAPRAAVDLFKDFQDDHKNIFQALKFLHVLVKQNPDKLEDFVFQGVPERIIENYRVDWPVDIHKEVISLFNDMVQHSEVKNKISEGFLDELIPILENHFKNKNIVLNGVHLLALCSDNIVSAETVQRLEGNKLADKILKSYMSSEKIIYDTLVVMENTIRMVNESKPEFLSWKTDDLVESVVETTNPQTQAKLNKQAVVVLELLRDKQGNNIQDTPLQDAEESENNKEDPMKVLEDTSEDIVDQVPPKIKKFLTQGKILRVYGDDKECKSMHVYLSQDMNDLRCKHPKENYVKQKWLMHIHQIKDVAHGYKKDSPIAKSGSIFKKPPKSENCFVVYGPTEMGWVKNFYIKCDNQQDAANWVEYLQSVLEIYRTNKAKYLKRDQQIS